MSDEKQPRELGWDDPIENESDGELQLLPDGEYPFLVRSFERARFGGGAKLPACPMAKLTIEVGGEDGVELTHNLYLHTMTEGLLSAFFRAIGQKKHGQPFTPNWGQVPGASGRCKVKVRDWIGRNGKKRQSNEIARFLDPVEGTPPGTSAKDGSIPF